MRGFQINYSDYGKRLTLLVPYRNRQEHLQAFIPHMLAYFARDKLDRHIGHKIYILEQASQSAFNRGKLLNAGFQLTRNDGDYSCFHDVDYLPIWADYSYSRQPTRLIWHGLMQKENYDRFFGAVVSFDNAVFEEINGFPNCYWGWGPEDLELGMRCEASGRAFDKRDGTFHGLKHLHNGFVAPGVQSEASLRNTALYRQRLLNFEHHQKTDGLCNVAYSVADRSEFVLHGQKLPNVLHYKIDIG